MCIPHHPFHLMLGSDMVINSREKGIDESLAFHCRRLRQNTAMHISISGSGGWK